jgi:Kef-type K+ transport system membrane component KefB
VEISSAKYQNERGKVMNPLRFLVSIVIGVGPAAVAIWLLFCKLAPYIVSVIPQGQYHSLFAVLTYVALSLLGGIEAVVISFVLGMFVAGLFIVGSGKRK